MTTTQQKLEACKRARRIAADSLRVSFAELLLSDDPISEVRLRDKWLEEMRKSSFIFPDGWYVPPPHGIGVLFASAHDEYGGRMNYKTLRKSPPKEDLFLDREDGITYLYASPVDRETGVIGDFGVVLYFGKNYEIKTHLQNCLAIDRTIFDHAQIGMSFADLTRYAIDLFKDQGLSNEVTSSTDPTGVNIGHTVPGTYEAWTKQELEILKGNNWDAVLQMISHKRKFLNVVESQVFQAGMTITLEPRLVIKGNPKVPMSSFHTIIVFNTDGSKELITNFGELFKFVDMGYMLKV